MKEIFKPIFDYENLYSVSNLGNVRRDKTSRGCCKSGRILKPGNAKNYLFVILYKEDKKKAVYVSRLVAEAFIGQRPKRMEINHIDGNKSNNHVDNLEYVTRSENVLHAFRTGLKEAKKGSKNNKAKITEEDVVIIRQSYVPSTNSIKILSKKFNLSKVTLYKIIKRYLWKHI